MGHGGRIVLVLLCLTACSNRKAPSPEPAPTKPLEPLVVDDGVTKDLGLEKQSNGTFKIEGLPWTIELAPDDVDLTPPEESQVALFAISTRLDKIQRLVNPKGTWSREGEGKRVFVVYDYIRTEDVELLTSNPYHRESQALRVQTAIIEERDGKYILHAANAGRGGRDCHVPSCVAQSAVEDLGLESHLPKQALRLLATIIGYGAGTDIRRKKLAEGARIKRMMSALQSPYWSDRKMAIYTLSKIRSPEALDQVLSAFDDEDSRVRLAVIWTLTGLEDDGVVELLIKALDDKDPDVRQLAAWTLGSHRNDAVIDALIEALNDERFSVRMYAAASLGLIEDERAVQPLVRALDDEHPQVIDKAAEALGRIGSDVALKPLVKHLDDPMARWAISEIDDERVVPMLEKAYTKSKNPYDRKEIAALLLEHWNEEVASFFMRKLKGPCPDHWMALWVFSKKKYPEAVAPAEKSFTRLKKRKYDEDGYSLCKEHWGYNWDYIEACEAQLIKVRALNGVSPVVKQEKEPPEDLEYIIEAAGSNDYRSRDWGIAALIEIAENEGTDRIEAILEKEDDGIASVVMWRIQGDDVHLETVETAIRNYYVNSANWSSALTEISAIADLLQGIEDPKIIDLLIELTHDVDYTVSATAVAALGETGSPRSTKHLIEALGSEHGEVVEAAAHYLGLRHEKSAVMPLIAAAEMMNGAMHSAEIPRALAQIGDCRAVRPLAIQLSEMLEGKQGYIESSVYALHVLHDVHGCHIPANAVFDLLDCPTGASKAYAIELLASEGTEKALDVVAEYRWDGDPLVRRALAEELPQWGERAVPYLLAFLEDEDLFVVLNALEGLGRTGVCDEATLVMLERMSRWPDEVIQRSAEHALDALSSCAVPAHQ